MPAPYSAGTATDSVEEPVRRTLAPFTQQHPGNRVGMHHQHYRHLVHVHHRHHRHYYHRLRAEPLRWVRSGPEPKP